MNTSKVELPQDVKVAMNIWRAQGCWGGVPNVYIVFHNGLAEAAVEALKALRITVHRTFVDDDGWMDGMTALYAIIEEPGGRLVKLVWNDSNQEFFEKGSGSWPYRFTAKV